MYFGLSKKDELLKKSLMFHFTCSICPKFPQKLPPQGPKKVALKENFPLAPIRGKQ